MKQIYYIMLDDIASNPNVKNWASMVKHTLYIIFFSCLGILRSWQCKEFSYFFSNKDLGITSYKTKANGSCVKSTVNGMYSLINTKLVLSLD